VRRSFCRTSRAVISKTARTRGRRKDGGRGRAAAAVAAAAATAVAAAAAAAAATATAAAAAAAACFDAASDLAREISLEPVTLLDLAVHSSIRSALFCLFDHQGPRWRVFSRRELTLLTEQPRDMGPTRLLFRRVLPSSLLSTYRLHVIASRL